MSKKNIIDLLNRIGYKSPVRNYQFTLTARTTEQLKHYVKTGQILDNSTYLAKKIITQ
jgi:hypothetical protein